MASMEVFVVTPERELWRGAASIVVARGSEGEVGIMVGHAPMLIELGIGPLYVQTENERLAVAVDGGFLHVISHEGETRVDVLAEHAELKHEIDVEAAQRQKSEAEQAVQSAKDEQEKAAAQEELSKAETRIDLQG